MASHRPVERRAGITRGVSATQKTLLRWVAQHPLLPAEYLTALVGQPARTVTVLLDALRRQDLIRVDTSPGFDAGAGPRYVLSVRGADWLAARDVVPLHVYLHEGTIAADTTISGQSHGRGLRMSDGSFRLMDLRRRPAHTMGVQRVALALAREAQHERARGHDHRLLVWRNAAEAQEWYRGPAGVGHIWPDAGFRYRVDGEVHDLLLEWDRGLVRRRDYVRKVQQYAAFYTTLNAVKGRPPHLVVVTPKAAVGRAQAVIDAAARCCPLFHQVATVLAADVVAEDRVMAVLRAAWSGAHRRRHAQAARR
jgi:hypothetical protein